MHRSQSNNTSTLDIVCPPVSHQTSLIRISRPDRRRPLPRAMIHPTTSVGRPCAPSTVNRLHPLAGGGVAAPLSHDPITVIKSGSGRYGAAGAVRPVTNLGLSATERRPAASAAPVPAGLRATSCIKSAPTEPAGPSAPLQYIWIDRNDRCRVELSPGRARRAGIRLPAASARPLRRRPAVASSPGAGVHSRHPNWMDGTGGATHRKWRSDGGAARIICRPDRLRGP